ncbi:aminoglycoside phosphotransferase family protein [Kribbella sp. GL6]|uniref:aminoglycoside phosphotransferase family protein n=1 Tax=Kribbella sp. GL6 TaxID=3419765 RepID=UPI003D065A9E
MARARGPVARRRPPRHTAPPGPGRRPPRERRHPLIPDPPDIVGRFGFEVSGWQVLAQRYGRLVARVETSHGPVVLKADLAAGAFVPEVEAVRRLAAAGLPVPEVLGHGPNELILSWTPGVALSSASPPPIQREAGRLLRTIHSLGSEPPYSGRPTVDLWIADWVESITSWWRTTGAHPDEVSQFLRWHHQLRPLLEDRGGDLILFDGRPEHFRVDGSRVGLIDLHDLGPGDAAMDLAVLTLDDPALLPAVLDGYDATADERETFAHLVPFYTELRRLSAAEWKSRTRSPGCT